jgi:hypothetical protein
MAKKDKVQEQTTAAPTAPVEQAQQSAPSLTLQDLVLVAQIIQLTSQRGAFKAEELADVGGLYNKLIAFLQSTGALTPAPAADTAAPTEGN